jgi:hypothetical protein
MKWHNMMAFAAFCCIAFLPALSQAGTIQIDMSGVNLTYTDADGGGLGTGTLVDTGGGTDSLSVVTIDNEGTLVGTLTNPTTPLAFDLSVSGIPSILVPLPNSSTSVTAPAGGSLELFVDGSSALDLDLDTVEVIYTRIGVGGFDIRLLFAGSVGEIISQDLPFDIAILDPVTVSFNMQGTSTQSLGFLTSFVASGVGTLTAEEVPEPATIAMLGLGSLMSLMVYSRYKLG